VASVSAAENCPESAIAAMPHTISSTDNAAGWVPNTATDTTQQPPLISIAALATSARPTRSDSRPPSRHPIASPSPITANAVQLAT
jgi:hypothetical protein